jgi:hypothetical protein
MRFALLLTLAGLAQADQLSDAFDSLKRAEAAKDAALVRQHALETSRLARLQIAEQVAPDLRNDYQKERSVYLTQTDTYTEYSMAVAANFPDTASDVVAQLFDSIVTLNRDSIYLDVAIPAYLNSRLGAEQEQVAQQVLALRPAHEDALLFLANLYALAGRHVESQQSANELLATIAQRPRPAIYNEDEWRAKVTTVTTSAHYFAGASACQLTKWVECDQHLRLIAQAPQYAAVNLMLARANYELARTTTSRTQLADALRFAQAAVAAGGPNIEVARQYVTLIQQIR